MKMKFIMLSIYGGSVVLYFTKILSGSHNFCVIIKVFAQSCLVILSYNDLSI